MTEWTQENLRAWPVHLKVQAILDLLAIPGYPPEEIGLMVDTIVNYRPMYVFEWGTNRGSSARIFYEASRLAAIPCEIHTTELPPDVPYLEHPGEESGLFVRNLPVEQHRGDGLQVTLELMALTDGHHSTVVYIDGEHSPPTALRELQEIHRARPEAVILLHDTAHNVSGPREALEEFLSDKPGRFRIFRVDVAGHPGLTRLAPR